ncbi:zinc ribbon domain-containing protein [Halosimplex pelagicum]|uniref:Zinc ribbon domain-containing protein n=1 Tax=Halosimplex pelagicum TaxID=869886 RepID=A0A7D5TW31_9EURY|nr:zinc ribbon domain-containing protein [Halosimplex pelagicum]QLH83694.1 zinc ribbon domain-containing protein [Halosimplex pelagicum]
MVDPGDRDGTDDGGGEPADGDSGDADAGEPSVDGESGGDTDAAGPTIEADDAEFPCPDCGDPLPADARFCPRCATPIGEDGEAVDLSELDGRFDEDPAELLTVEAGERRASGRVMVLAGLAVALPLAPLGLFLMNTVRVLSLWSAALVFLGCWLAPAAYLARARVPAEAFARSCYFVAAGTALIPAGLRFGGNGIAAGDLSVSVALVTAVALLVAGLAALLGTFMRRQASRRVTGDLRAFEEARPDSEDTGEN